MTFALAADGRSITCLRCGKTSHNPTDVAEYYCGNCKVFHEHMRPCATDGCKMILVLVMGDTLPTRCNEHSP